MNPRLTGRVARPRLLTAAIIGMSNQANANPKLTGLKNVDVVIEDVTEQDKKCGISEDDIKSYIVNSLIPAGIKINSESRNTFYISTSTLSFEDGDCVTYIETEVLFFEKVQNPNNKYSYTHRVHLYSDGELLSSGSRSRHGVRVKESVIGHMDRFLAEWRIANQ